MKKRRVGQRSEIIIDSIDLAILDLLHIEGGGIGIMEMQTKLGIAHNSLRPHLERLKRLDWIEFNPVEKSRKILLTITKDGEKILYKIFYRKKD